VGVGKISQTPAGAGRDTKFQPVQDSSGYLHLQGRCECPQHCACRCGFNLEWVGHGIRNSLCRQLNVDSMHVKVTSARNLKLQRACGTTM